jgi:putative integral membrane protein (TIGR02587 family)
MEVWWIGSHTDPEVLLVVLALLFVTLVLLNATAGFRRSRDVTLAEAVEDSVQALAVGLVATAAVLVMLRQITFDTPLSMALGRVVVESVPFCLGIGVARFLLQGDPGIEGDEGDEGATDDDHEHDEDDEAGDDGDGGDGGDEETELASSVADIGATALGAAFVGLSIAPTDEVPMLAAAMAPPWQIVVVVASLAISYAIVFVGGFSGQDRRHSQRGVFQRPVTETIITYLVALIVAAVLLWVFQRDVRPEPDLLARVVVLGLPAAVGGSLGRLAL